MREKRVAHESNVSAPTHLWTADEKFKTDSSTFSNSIFFLYFQRNLELAQTTHEWKKCNRNSLDARFIHSETKQNLRTLSEKTKKKKLHKRQQWLSEMNWAFNSLEIDFVEDDDFSFLFSFGFSVFFHVVAFNTLTHRVKWKHEPVS